MLKTDCESNHHKDSIVHHLPLSVSDVGQSPHVQYCDLLIKMDCITQHATFNLLVKESQVLFETYS